MFGISINNKVSVNEFELQVQRNLMEIEASQELWRQKYFEESVRLFGEEGRRFAEVFFKKDGGFHAALAKGFSRDDIVHMRDSVWEVRRK